MADTQLKMTSPPNSYVEDCKKHLMNIFEDMTKDCEDKNSRNFFDNIRDYDALNAKAIQIFCSMVDFGFLDEARELFKPLSGQVTLPQVVVFTMVISTYVDNRHIKDAHKVYQQMIASGVTPTTYTYALLICGFALDHSNLDYVGYAKKYFLEMLDRV
ncbi:PREDICTED: pentatricopeptide repeat-containing protein At4g38150-like [Fragaria vesca subsp. vesca]|uniref:pentatricopeptide repeat-containing protein At4g38150-like n=1 Tax=Fragaria vesca subsp. vesca TaxID=101020 RepID=UPI0002C2FDD8|nr:PREDICTED: pentatricopeptide repeat-containing protein At4g38150-like [Fragaria vesca subsp. vesca]